MRKLWLFLICATLQYACMAQQNHFYVKTSDSLPYLNYGLGTDRLGGAKMGFLDSNVVLKVVDSFATQYQVQLSKSRSAWIEKTKTLPIVGVDVPQYLSGSWKVWGDSIADYVSIGLPARLPYASRMEMNPARIVLEIFGATSNTNWITQLKTAKGIKNVWYVQKEDDVMEVFLELKHQTHWGYDVYYDSLKRLTLRVKRPPPSLALRRLKIAVDAGHGGDQPGARGRSSGILEKDYTLLYAKALEAELKKRGAQVIMTRDKDTTLSMYERLTFLKKENPDLLISVHFNSASIDTVGGVSTYYRYVGFRPLSQYILDEMLTTGLNNFGNIGSFNFSLSGPIEYPNALVEVAFLSNPGDEQRIQDPKFPAVTATKIRRGIENFLKNAR